MKFDVFTLESKINIDYEINASNEVNILVVDKLAMTNQILSRTTKTFYCRNTLEQNEFILLSMTCCCWLINNDSAICDFLANFGQFQNSFRIKF